MGQRVIPVAVTAEYIGGDGVTLGAAGSHDSVVIEYDFRAAGPMWDDVTVRYVLWTNPQGNTTNRVNLGVDKLVPGYDNKVYHASPTADAMCVAGWAEMVVVGAIISDGNEVIKVKTEPSRFRVLPGSSRAADNEGVAATVADQLQAEIEAVDDRKVNKPMTPNDPNGEPGQVLTSLGDGQTKWMPALDVQADQIYEVLDEHPEWMTRVGDGTITADKLATGAVTTDKIASKAVTTGKLEDKAVTTGKIGDGAVTEDKLAAGAVTTGKIVNKAVTGEKLSDELTGELERMADEIEDIQTSMTSTFTFKGSVDDEDELPASNNTVGDTYYVKNLGYHMSWTAGGEWEQSSKAATNPSEYAVDEYGSVFETQNELYLHHKMLGDCPQYEYKINDLETGKWNSEGEWTSSGYSTRRHPIPYDDTLTLTINHKDITLPCNLYLYFVEITGGEIEIKYTVIYNFTAPAPIRLLNLRRFRASIQNPGDTFVILGTSHSDQTVLTEFVKLYRRANDCQLKVLPIMHPQNYNRTDFHCNESRRPVYFSHSEGRYENVRGGMKWLYANGRPIDAVFYDADGNTIQASANGLGPIVTGNYYPTVIRIPEGADTMKCAIYGWSQFNNSVWNLSVGMMEDYNDIGIFSEAEKSAGRGLYVGRAIHNVLTLMKFRYPARQISTRYYVFNDSNGGQSDQTLTGLPYGEKILNYSASYYSYLTMIQKNSGFNASTTPTSRNYNVGLKCVALMCEAMGITDPYQGVEWWLQNFADKMELLDASSLLNVGDLVITIRYRHTQDSQTGNIYRALDSHMLLITAVLWDDKTGRFGGYLTAEHANVWNQQIVKSIEHMLPSPLTEREKSIDTNHEAAVASWRLPVPITNVPKSPNKYVYTMDQQLDPLNHPERIVPPPVLGPMGDRCLIGPGKNYWGAPSSICNIYAEKTYETITVKYNGELVATLLPDMADGENANYRVFDISGILALHGPGVYTAFADDNETPGTFLYPDLPTWQVDHAFQTVHIDGLAASGTGEDLKLVTDYFDKFWVRVIPWPVAADGFPDGTPWANYVNVQAEELWDGENITIPIENGKPKYQYIVSITAANCAFGAVTLQMRKDFNLIDYEDPSIYIDDEPSADETSDDQGTGDLNGIAG